ncbi:response regulator [Microaceticoccus formicicus]|uniref:response regulator n=1 Tax=Microaceticoccus formicicus TaxID=3118105 RepID=UPI003CD03D23|nr:response regulator transcription factor [Peptoniphilaceae bacterium AMB_02]
MNKIRLLLVDDEKLIRQGLQILLMNFEDIEVIGMASNGREAYEMVKSNKPDVVLMDIRMPEHDGIEGTKLIKSYDEDIKIIILTTFKDSEYIESALKLGASGYLLKDSSEELIYSAIKASLSGNIIIHPEMTTEILAAQCDLTPNTGLLEQGNITNRELEIMKLIADGLSNKEISESLFLSEGTVKNNISVILSKLELRDRTQIAVFMYKNKLI